MPSVIQALSELEQNNVPGILCTIINTRGSTPRHEGSKMLVHEDGSFIGTVGGGEVEGRVIKEALEALKESKNRVLHYEMVNPKEGDPGVCGGQLEIFVEPIIPRPILLIIGAGHVGKALAHLARWLNFYVVISDDREDFCNPQVNPDGDSYLPFPMTQLPEKLKITPYTYIVLTTRGMTVDVEGMPNLLSTQAAFIGVIGSRRRWAVTKKALLEKPGITEDVLARVHSPIGLELKAETPEEIAVSIMAEIIMERNGGNGKSMKA